MTKKELKNKVEELRELEENWDSYGGYPITEISIEKAHYIIDLIPVSSLSLNICVVPISNGSINLEWIYKDKELELETDGKQIIYLKCSNNEDGSNLCEEGYLRFDDKEFTKKFYDFFEWLGCKKYPCPDCDTGELYDSNAGGMFGSIIKCDNPKCKYEYSDI